MATTQPAQSIIIEPQARKRLSIPDLWNFRELAYYLAWRDIKVRYKQTIMGAGWAIMRPVLTMIVFTFVFGQVAQVDTGEIPYPIFNYAALLPWTLFSTAIAAAANSLVNNGNMIKKIYFPRVILPVSGLLSSLVDFLPAFGILLILMLVYQIPLQFGFVLVPVLLLLTLVIAAGIGFWLAATNVLFRDVRYATPFLIQMLMWLSPIGYPVSEVPEGFRTLFALNPLVGVIEGFRYALLGSPNSDLTPFMLLVSCVGALLLFVSGIWYFYRMESTFADVV